MADIKGRPVSPRNGQPLPRGKPFTSETAREAAQKSNHLQAERKSIAQAFRKNMERLQTVKEGGKEIQLTGAEIVARSIMTACNKGNANAMNIALALMGEKPAENINVNTPDPAIMEEVRAFLDAKSNEP